MVMMMKFACQLGSFESWRGSLAAGSVRAGRVSSGASKKSRPYSIECCECVRVLTVAPFNVQIKSTAAASVASTRMSFNVQCRANLDVLSKMHSDLT